MGFVSNINECFSPFFSRFLLSSVLSSSPISFRCGRGNCKERCDKHAQSDLQEYGVGIVLYFKYLKMMTILFTLYSLFCIPALALYGEAIKDKTAPTTIFNFVKTLSKSSVGNLGEVLLISSQVRVGEEVSTAEIGRLVGILFICLRGNR